MGENKLNIIEALQVVTQKIKDWVNKKISNMATGLVIVDNTLFLKTSDGYMSEYGVSLPQSEENVGISKRTDIVMTASEWRGENGLYFQVVECDGITVNSKIDLQPTPSQVVELKKMKASLMATNSDQVVTVYAFGNKPTTDMTMQALITEVAEI